MSSTKVLYVDDEPSNLIVFKAQFKKTMQIFTAGSGREALEILAKEEIPVVLSDQKMPGMTGAELLTEVRKRYPQAIRMIVTAYTDFDQVLQSINEGHVERYITKPWNAAELHSLIVGACELYYKRSENLRLTEDVMHQERLVAIGTVTLGLVRQLESIGACFKTLENIESQSQDLALARLELFLGGVHELSAILRGLRLYSKKGQGSGSITDIEDLNSVVTKSAEILRLFPAARKTGALEVRTHPGPLYVEIDGERMKQIVVNLALHLLSNCRADTPDLRVTTSVDEESAVISFWSDDLEFSDDSSVVLQDGLHANARQTQSAFWMLLAQKVLGEYGGSLLSPGDGELLQLRLPLHYETEAELA